MANNTNHSSVIGTDGPGQRSTHKQDLRDLTENYWLVTTTGRTTPLKSKWGLNFLPTTCKDFTWLKKDSGSVTQNLGSEKRPNLITPVYFYVVPVIHISSETYYSIESALIFRCWWWVTRKVNSNNVSAFRFPRSFERKTWIMLLLRLLTTDRILILYVNALSIERMQKGR